MGKNQKARKLSRRSKVCKYCKQVLRFDGERYVDPKGYTYCPEQPNDELFSTKQHSF